MLTGGKTEKRNMMTGYAAATSRMELKVMDQQFSSTTARNHSTSAVQKKRRGSQYSIYQYHDAFLVLVRRKPQHFCTWFYFLGYGLLSWAYLGWGSRSKPIPKWIHTCYKSLKMHKNEPKGQCKPQSCSGYARCRYYGPVSGVDKPERSLSCSRSTHQWQGGTIIPGASLRGRKIT